MSFDDIDPRDLGHEDDDPFVSFPWLGGPAGGVPELAGNIAKGMVRQLASDLKRPAGRVEFAASCASAFALRRSGMPPLLAVLLGVAIGFSAGKLYEMAEDIHETSLEQRAYLHEQLRRQAEEQLRAGPEI